MIEASEESEGDGNGEEDKREKKVESETKWLGHQLNISDKANPGRCVGDDLEEIGVAIFEIGGHVVAAGAFGTNF